MQQLIVMELNESKLMRGNYKILNKVRITKLMARIQKITSFGVQGLKLIMETSKSSTPMGVMQKFGLKMEP